MPTPHVRMYATGYCPYCHRAEALLKSKGIAAIEMIRIDLDPSKRRVMIDETGRNTVPQIYIGSTHIGGCDDLVALDNAGGLDALLQAPAA